MRINLNINGVDIELKEVQHPKFVVYGGEDMYPMLQSRLEALPDTHPYRVYESIRISGKFYAPIN